MITVGADAVVAMRGGLTVSCQAYPGEPMRDPRTTAQVARSVVAGGAVALRIQGIDDLRAVVPVVDVPVVGLWKDGEEGVLITPTVDHALAVLAAGADVVAVDGTRRPRPDGRDLAATIAAIRAVHPGAVVMADCGSCRRAVQIARTRLRNLRDLGRVEPVAQSRLHALRALACSGRRAGALDRPGPVVSRTGNEEGEPGPRQLGHGTIRVMEFREATGDDLDLLYDLMLEAFNWDGTPRFTRSEVVADTHTARYLGGWISPGDFGVVAVDEGRPVGAVWARSLPAAAPGYGYVDDDIPEIGMAVTSEARGRGVGTALLTRCINQARTLECKGLSLSVEDGNTAARTLYERCGFVTVGRTGNSDTMLLEF